MRSRTTIATRRSSACALRVGSGFRVPLRLLEQGIEACRLLPVFETLQTRIENGHVPFVDCEDFSSAPSGLGEVVIVVFVEAKQQNFNPGLDGHS